MTSRKIRNMEEFSTVSGISRPTLSKYFNAPDSVRKTTRDRIELALDSYDFRPNLFAVNQNRKASRCIGIVVPHLLDPFYAEIIRHIEARCMAAGYWVIVLSSHQDPELEQVALERLRALKPAGVIFAPLGHKSDLRGVEKFAHDIATVTFDTPLLEGASFVGNDNNQSVRMIVDYLCGSGSAPCFLDMPNLNRTATERRLAYISAMEARGLAPLVLSMEGEMWDFENAGYETGKRLISERALLSTTVLCANDRVAIGMISAAWEMGLRVGQGAATAMRIAGHDDHPQARFMTPALTTVAQDYAAIAAACTELLFEKIEGDMALGERSIRLEGSLVLRSSA